MRCKDCKYLITEKNGEECSYKCKVLSNNGWITAIYVEKDIFCRFLKDETTQELNEDGKKFLMNNSL